MDSLERRGREIEVLFGFRHGSRLALLPPTGLVHAEVTLEADDDGAVRCRLAGQPGVLVRVGEAFWLDVRRLAAILPAIVSELVRRTDATAARALLEEAPLLEPLEGDRLKDLILAHQIHANDLLLLGDAPRAHAALDGPPHFTLRFPSGTLELAYTNDGYRAAHASTASPFAQATPDVTVRWNDAPIALDRAIRWNDGDLAELLVLAHGALAVQPEVVIALFEAVLGGADASVLADEALPADLRATLLNLWGVALRREGRLDEAVATLTRALPLAVVANPQLEQEVTYNRGYARLETSMKSRTGRDGVGVAPFTSHFDVVERHRESWRACLADFERAHALDPEDPSATSQVALTRKLLGLLDGTPPSTPAADAEKKSKPRAAKAPLPPPKPTSAIENWIGLVLVLGVLVVLVVMTTMGRRPDAAPSAPLPPPSTVASAPSAHDLSERARLVQLAGPDHTSLLLEATAAPCPIAVHLPTDVGGGEVVAPHLARAVGTGELYGTEYFDATVRHYLSMHAPYADALALFPSVGPLHDPSVEAPDVWTPASAFRLTLLVTDWHDPVILEGGGSLARGAVAARLIVWSYPDSRFVCATPDVRAENREGLTIVRAPYGSYTEPEDDALNRARVDLIEQVLRIGIPRLAAVPP